MKKLLLLFLVLMPCALFAQQLPAISNAPVDPNNISTVNDSTHWKYSELTNPMNNNVYKIAEIYSQNKIDLKTPYDGGTLAFIEIANIPRSNGKPTYHLIFGITKGQIRTSIYYTLLQLKFDNQNSFYVGLKPLTDDNSQIATDFGGLISSGIKQAEKFVGHTKLIVEVNVYDNGMQYFYFDVSGFDLSRLD